MSENTNRKISKMHSSLAGSHFIQHALFEGGFDEAGEERVWFVGLGLELRMELAGDVEFVGRELNDLDQAFFGADRTDDQAFGFELLAVVGVEFETMAMALGDVIDIMVELCRLGSCKEDRFTGAKAHVVAHGGEFFLLFLQADHGMRCVFVELGGVSIGETADIARKLDGGDLHAEADAEIRNVVFTRILGGINFAFDATITESTGNEDAIDVTDDLGGDLVLHGLGIDLHDLHFGIVRGTGMDE